MGLRAAPRIRSAQMVVSSDGEMELRLRRLCREALVVLEALEGRWRRSGSMVLEFRMSACDTFTVGRFGHGSNIRVL
jgi:hypothetical protein